MRRFIPPTFRPVVLMALACMTLVGAPMIAAAQTVAEQATSLSMVPKDAAAYSVVLHNKDVFEAVIESKAYAKFAEIEEVKPMLDDMKQQWEQVAGDPATKGVVQVLLDGVSEEVFFYADTSYFRLAKIFQQASAHADLASEGDDPDPQASLRHMLDVLSDHAGELETPKMIIGLRVQDPDAAKGLVSLVKLGLRPQLAEVGLADRLVEEEVGGVKLVTLKLDGAMIPWEEFPADDISGEAGKYDPLIAKMKTMTVAFSLGVKDNFLLLSMGPTSELIGTLGDGDGLASREEFARLAELKGQKLRSISYVSEEGARLAMDMSPIVSILNSIPYIAQTNEEPELREKLQEDAREAAKDIQKLMGEPGAILSASTFSPRGFDVVTYNWSRSPILDGSKKLTLLDHMGGSPIAWMVAREKRDIQQYELVVKYLKIIEEYFRLPAERGGDDLLGKYDEFMKEMEPLFARLDKANREMIMPALEDGQSALVLDAQLTSKQWFAQMPASPHPLPMLEMAVVMGVSDAKLLEQGSAEYFAVAQETADILHELTPEDIPETEIPLPKTRKVAGGKIHYYLLPKELGVDKRIAPNAGLGKNVAVLSATPLQTKRILKPTPVASAGPVAKYKDEPLVSAGGFNFAAAVDAALPWVEYVMASDAELEVQEIEGEAEDAETDEPELIGRESNLLRNIRTGAEVLKCFRGYSSVSYLEDGAQVSRGEWHFEDLE